MVAAAKVRSETRALAIMPQTTDRHMLDALATCYLVIGALDLHAVCISPLLEVEKPLVAEVGAEVRHPRLSRGAHWG